MNLLPMKTVGCLNCGHPTLLLSTILAEIVQRQPESARDERQIGWLCPVCKHLVFGVVGAEPQESDPQQQPLFSGKSAYAIQLRCAEESCQSRVLALAILERGITPGQEIPQMSEWLGGGLTCRRDDPPKSPLELCGVFCLGDL